MKYLLILLLSLNLFGDILQEDKKKHLIYSTAAYLGCRGGNEILKTQNITYLDGKVCIGLIVGAAILKEVYDKHHNGTPEFNDFSAGVVAPLGIEVTIYSW